MQTVAHPRIGIIGSGALGSTVGIRLGAMGYPVSFLMRSDYEAVRDSGRMELHSMEGERIVLNKPQVFRSVEAMGTVDWVVIGLKTTRNYLFKELLPPVVGPQTVLITLQNGLGNVEALQKLFPDNSIVGALCQIGVNREGPGQIRSYVPGGGFIQLGQVGIDGTNPLLESIQAALQTAGIRTKIVPSLGEALWRKLMWNVPFNGLTVVIGGKGTDVVCNDPELRAEARALMEEIRTAAVALGYPIEPAYTDRLLSFTDDLGPYMASSVLDWKAGRRVEVEAIFENPLKAGEAAGVDMPCLEKLVVKLSSFVLKH